MKKFKKILALTLSLAMVLGISLTSFAVEGESNPNTHAGTGKSGDKGTITISNIAQNAAGSTKTVAVTAYQIVKAKYGRGETSTGADDGYFSGYADVYTADDLPQLVNMDGKIKEINDTDLAAIRAYIEEQSVTGTAMDLVSGKTDSYSAEVPVGMYLVVITGAEGKIYSNIVISTQYVTDAGEDGTGSVIGDGSLAIVDGMAWAKVQDNPTITKKIVEGKEKKDGNSANVGDTVSFEIEAQIPYYGGPNPVYKITDTLVGLTLETSTPITVKVYDKEGAEKTGTFHKLVNEQGQEIEQSAITDKITLDFVTTNADGTKTYNLKDCVGGRVVVTYKATVSGTHYNQDPNTNTAELTYTHNSNVSGEGEKGTTDDVTKTYTFDLSGELTGSDVKSLLSKTGESTSTTTEKLGGAVFELYQKKEDGTKKLYTNTAMLATDLGNDTKTTYVTSSTADATKGQLSIRGLAAGTYYLKEVTAPEGYSLSTKEYKIVVDATIEEGKLISWSIKFYDGESDTTGKTLLSVDNGEKKTDGVEAAAGNIPNTKLSQLPSTGGIGTTIFTIGGCAIMILAAALYFASRRKAAK